MDAFEREIAKAWDAVEGEDTSSSYSGGKPFPARILVVGPDDSRTQHMLTDLEACGHRCTHVERTDQAIAVVESEHFELLLLNAAVTDGCHALLDRMNNRLPTAKTLLYAPEPTPEHVIHAMRLGAIDFLQIPMAADQLEQRIVVALEKSRLEERREERIQRLKVICQELNTARKEIADQLDLICREVMTSHKGISEQLHDVAMASEFRTLIKQELDVEDMLRTSLEYLLSKTGPTNAAVYLADGEGAYSLGAYVNYDCPRETIAEVLEHLGAAICPQMESESQIVSFADAREFASWLDLEMGVSVQDGSEIGSLAESQVIAFSCADEGECQAVIVLFRAATKPFADSLTDVIDTLRPIFAAQLANVAQVHTRALPSWPGEAIGEDEDFYDGHGFGGLAA